MPKKEEEHRGQKPDLRKIVEDLKKMDPRIKSIKTIGDAKSPIFQLEFENRGKHAIIISQQTVTSSYEVELTETTYVLDRKRKLIKTGEKKAKDNLDTPKINLRLLLIKTSKPITENQENALWNWFEEWQQKKYEESEPFLLIVEEKELSIEADISETPSLPDDIRDFAKELIEIAPMVTQEDENILRKNK